MGHASVLFLSYCKLWSIFECSAEVAIRRQQLRAAADPGGTARKCPPSQQRPTCGHSEMVAGIDLDYTLAAAQGGDPLHQPLNDAVVRPRRQLSHFDPDRRGLGR